MTTLVRRQHPRVTLPIVAYMEIEPGCGAIVLNVSRDGLCFQSVAPVDPDGPIDFFFKENNRRMAGSGELVWIDERRKSGGVRFTRLSPEARDQINTWVANAPGDDAGPADEPHRYSDDAAAADNLPAKAPAQLKVAIKGDGFSTGLAAGLLISLALTSVLLFAYAHQRELGEVLIRIGKRLEAHPEVKSAGLDQQPAFVTPQVEATAPPAPQTSTSAAEPPMKTQDPASSSQSTQAEDSDPEVIVRHAATPQSPALAPVEKSTQVQPPAGSPAFSSATTSDVAQDLASAAAPPVLPSIPAETPPNLVPNETAAQPITATAPTTSGPETPVQMFFDLGKFKDEPSARDVKEKVAGLGLRTSVLKSRFLWKTSYQVLVGPYTNEGEEAAIQEELSSRGYKPRPFERGSRQFMVRSRLNLNGSQLPLDESFTVSWESYVENASVRFTRRGILLASAHGKWVERPQKYSRDEYVYLKSGSSKTLVEIHFSGLKRALVFGGSS